MTTKRRTLSRKTEKNGTERPENGVLELLWRCRKKAAPVFCPFRNKPPENSKIYKKKQKYDIAKSKYPDIMYIVPKHKARGEIKKQEKIKYGA